MSAAATAAPSVNEPSAVMSGKAKIRKLMNTPSASSARISPMVQEPMSSVMATPSPRRSARGTTQKTPRVKVLSPAPTIGRESPSRCNTFSTRPGSNRSWTVGASSNDPLGSGRYGTTAA